MSFLTIPRARFTEKSCYGFIEVINSRFKNDGVDWRLEVSPRNGYCAVDCYKATEREAGNTGVYNNVQCGTPRQCAESARDFYYREAK